MDVKCKITLDNLFIKYGREPFLRWVKSLSIFRFCKAYSKDMKSDHFLAVIKYSNEKDYENILLKMNLDIATSKPSSAQFRKYTEFSIAGWQLLNGILCYMDVNKIHHTIVLEVSGTNEDPFALDESTYQSAKNIEEFIITKEFHFVEPPIDDKKCICPKYYQTLWTK